MRKLITAIAFGAALIAAPAIAAETPSTGGSQGQSSGAAQKNAPHDATTHDNKENAKDKMMKK
jgi:hypothetical protein